MNLLADARAFHEHGGLLGRVGKPRQLHGERRLLRERHQQLALLHVLGVALKGQHQKADAARAEHQRIDHGADRALTAMKGEHARPDLRLLAGDLEIHGLAQLREPRGERRAVHRHAGGEGRLPELPVAYVRDDAPLLQRVLQHDHRTGDRVELARRLEQHVAHEAVQVGLAGETLEVGADHGVGRGEPGDSFLRGTLALAAHVIDEALAMQRGTDHAGGGLERGQLGSIDGPLLAGVVEAHHPDELARHEDRHDRLGLGADALDARCGVAAGGLVRAEAHAAPGAQLCEHAGELTLVARETALLRQVRRHARPRPLARHHEQRLALRAGARFHDADAIDVGRLPDQPQHTRDGGAHVGGLEQQAARRGGSGEQPLACPQGLVDLAELFRTGSGLGFRFQDGHIRVHVWRYSQAFQGQIGKSSAPRTGSAATDASLYLKRERGGLALGPCRARFPGYFRLHTIMILL